MLVAGGHAIASTGVRPAQPPEVRTGVSGRWARPFATRTSRSSPSSRPAAPPPASPPPPATPFACLMDCSPVSSAAEFVGTDDDDDHITALQAVGHHCRQRNIADRQRRLTLTFLEKAALISGVLASGRTEHKPKIWTRSC
jgi:hypothetical protein